MGPKCVRLGPGALILEDGALVDLYRDCSIAPLVDMRRKLRAVFGTAEALARVAGLGFAEMKVSDKFLQSIVRHREERLFLGGGPGFWKTLCHVLVGGSDLTFPPSPFLQCDPGETAGGSGVIADPALVDAKFREAWMPYFSRSVEGSADLDDFSVEVGGGWLPVLDVFHLPPLAGDALVDVVRRKKPTAGGLDGREWRELKALPPSWFDGLARILWVVEESGVCLEGLLDACVAMIPKSGGGATPLGQRPLCIACGLWGLGVS